MTEPSRRRFLKTSAAGLAAIGAQPPGASAAGPNSVNMSSMVFLQNDNLNLTPAEVTAQLAQLCAGREVTADSYGLEGEVAEVEKYFARLLGKERAIFMPTGTLANHLALRALAGNRRRVVVQDVSHVYNDSGDACQMLSGLTLLPLAAEKSTFTWADVERVASRTASGRVATAIGAISIESPVRRLSGELFVRAEMQKICAAAKKQGIGTHLDGARLFIASAYTGISPAEYAAPFDTVYVSLWKTFNTLNGAILAGPAALLENLFHTRRMFGGALFNTWPFALLARRFAESYIEHLSAAVGVSNAFFEKLAGTDFKVDRVPNGTNVFRMTVAASRAERLRERLLAQGIVLPAHGNTPAGAVFNLQVNETWNRTKGQTLAEQFQRALSG